jgi:Flp pilus assembly pilin Flp
MRLLDRSTRIGSRCTSLLRDESGQSVTEYAVVMALITLVALVSISATGLQALDVLRRTANSLH